MEAGFGELGDVSLVQSKLPKKLKKRRAIATEDGPSGYVVNAFLICPLVIMGFVALVSFETYK